jgi:hypothetical protein
MINFSDICSPRYFSLKKFDEAPVLADWYLKGESDAVV